MRKGNSLNPRNGWDRGILVPWAFKQDQLQPFAPLFFWKFSIFFTFILGSPFLLPRGPIMRKGNSLNPRNGPDRALSVPGAFKLDQLQPFAPLFFWKFSILFTFILGSPLLLPQMANNEKREFSQPQIWMRQRDFSALGLQTGPIAAFCTSLFLKIFHLFHLHTGEPILITPEGQ